MRKNDGDENGASEFCLALNKSTPAQIVTVARQDIEGEEGWLATMKEQIVELGATVRIETDDFSV